jgi:uncharacterized surface protein with fasciclin (FAS1) repeats
MPKRVSKCNVVCLIAAVVCALAVFGCQGDGNGYVSPGLQTIYQTTSSAPYLETFHKAVQEAGLAATLNGIGPYTVFAPSNEAFAEAPGGAEKLLDPANRDELVKILNRHIVGQAIYSENAAKLQQVRALDGTDLNLGRGVEMGQMEGAGRYYNWKKPPGRQKYEYLTVDGAAIVRPDIMCSNGVIHVIDKVLMP